MHKPNTGLYFLILAVVAITVGGSLIYYSDTVIGEITEYDSALSRHANLPHLEKHEPIIAKGLYLTAYSAASAKKRAEIIELIKKTELNTVVIDIKDYTGYVLYDSSLPLVRTLKTGKPIIKNIRSVIDEFKKAGIYVIARQTVFQDPVLAKAKPEWAITTSGGGRWKDYKGLSWVDPTLVDVWKYNMSIAKEAIRLGFDEINFDYVRFPSDGNIKTAIYANLQSDKATTMKNFYHYVGNQLKDSPAYTSFDLFGLVLESHDFDMNIGQKLSSTLDTVDYICPMSYPSHYTSGYLQFTNPADHPYEVVHNGLTKSEIIMQTAQRSKLRPWVQAFNLGATYDAAKIRAQIKAIEESPYSAGWLLWNAANRYTTAGLTLDAS
jgi:hypothetical protein